MRPARASPRRTSARRPTADGAGDRRRVASGDRAATGEDDLVDVSLRIPRAVLEGGLARELASQALDDHGRFLLAARILRARRRRTDLLPGLKFGEPSWEMVLDLYVSTYRGERVDMMSLCRAGGGAQTTVFTEVGALVRQGYLSRKGDPLDRRRKFVTMTPKLKVAIDHWLDEQAVAVAADTVARPR